MKRFLFAMALLSLAPALRAEDFESFEKKRLEENRLHLPNLLGGGIYKAEPIQGAEFDELKAFYREKLSLKDSDQFFAEQLAPIFRMIQGRPVRPYYNDFLIWVKRGNKFVYILRPVDTVTGCDTACAPIVFHLVMDPKGHVINLLEDPKEPLRKIYHTLMTDADKQKLLKILKKLPEAFRGIDHPDRLTNSFTTYPPQTWTFFAPSVVEGAAYSSYRIYEAALQVQQRMQNKDNEVDLLTDLYGKLFRITDVISAQAFLREIAAPATKKKMGPAAQAFAVSAFYEVMLYLAQEHLLTAEELRSYLRGRRDRKNEIQHQCALVRDLFPYPDLVPVAIKEAVQCPKDIRDLYSDLIQGKFWESATNQTPPFLLKDEKAFFYFFDRFTDGSKSSPAYHRMLAEALVYFPDAAKREKLGVPEKPTDDDKRFLNEAVADYRDGIRKKYVNPWTDAQIKGFFASGSDTPQERTLPVSSVVVFFAPWCPHCQKLLHSWGAEKQLDKNLKDKIYLIESFANDSSMKSAKDVCKKAGLSGDLCGKHLWVFDKDRSEALVKTIGLYTIPRILVTNRKGQVLVFDYQIDIERPLQSNQDLLFLLDEVNQATDAKL